jgi:radical SAM superfamily enzyme YgiQ (UPF0313 family)
MKKNYNLLLINPWIYDFTAYDFWSKPLGLLYIASILREQGYEISYIDCMDRYNQEVLKLQNRKFPKKDKFGRGPFFKEEVKKPEVLKNIPRRYSRYGITEEIFLNKLKKLPSPQGVLITSIMTYWYPGAFRVIEIIKKIFPDIPIILGGVYATLCFEHVFKFSGADYVIKGNSIRDLLYSDLDYISILSSRGCPYRCSYCASFKINPKLEFRNPEKVAKEIEYWNKRRGVKDFVFYDDALLINSEDNFLIILEELINKKLDIRLHTPNGIHARMINKEMAHKMYQAGVETIRLGFETVDPRVQSETGGKITSIEFKKAVNYLLEAGFKPSQIGAYLLIGMPGQDVQKIIDSICFVIDCGAHPRLAKFSAIPGTKIWDKARTYFNLKGDVDPLFHNDALLPYLSPDLTAQAYQQIKSIIKI